LLIFISLKYLISLIMAEYYHIQITNKDSQDLYQFDIADSYLVTKMAQNYQKGIPFLLNGEAVDPYDVKRIKIAKTYFSSGLYTPQNNSPNARFNAVLGAPGNDVTLLFITSPPPTKSGQIQSRSNDAKMIHSSEKVFIVHGHDHAAKFELDAMLRRWGLEPILLAEQTNAGKTVIEKFETNSVEAGYAFILLTPDDVGGKDKDHLMPRARQNVILELGAFILGIGRNRICILSKHGVEIPSDIQGVVRLEYRDRIDEQYRRIRQELIAAGYNLKPDV